MYLRDKVVQSSIRNLHAKLWPEVPLNERKGWGDGSVIHMPPSTLASEPALNSTDVTPCQCPAVQRRLGLFGVTLALLPCKVF